MAARYAVGVDVGGTKIYAGVIELESGKVVGSQRKRTHPERGLDFFVKRLTDVITSALDAADLPKGAAPLGIGVGIAGQVDRESGVLLTGPNLGQGLDNLPIRDLLQKQFKLPVYLGNDVEVATYGEHHYGAGRDCDDFVCIFVGTGIGAGISSLATFYNPDRIILGGGLIDATTLLFDRTALRTHESTLPAATRALAVHRAQLGDDSGIIGAAWMAEAQQVNALT